MLVSYESCFITDKERHLLGRISIKELIINDPNDKIDDISVKLSVGSIQTDEIMVPEVQDLTYYINWKSHTVRRFYYDGLWYDYDDWYATYYNLWMNDDYIKFSGY